MSIRKLYLIMLLLFVCHIGGAQGLSPTTPAKEYIRFNGQIVAVENALPSTGGLTSQPSPEKAPSVWASNRPALSLLPALPLIPAHKGATLNSSLPNRSLMLSHSADVSVLSRSSYEQASLLLTRSWLTLLRSSSSPNPALVHTP